MLPQSHSCGIATECDRPQPETEVRRETISTYLKEAGVELRPPRGRLLPPKPASRSAGVTTDSRPAEQPFEEGTADVQPAKPASGFHEVIPDPGAEAAGETAVKPEPQPGCSPSVSVCEAYRDAIELGLSRGRNAKAVWRLPPAKKLRSITVRALWSAMRAAANTGARGYSC
jgi:hypothetical protein